jgi:hypothetical protein
MSDKTDKEVMLICADLQRIGVVVLALSPPPSSAKKHPTVHFWLLNNPATRAALNGRLLGDFKFEIYFPAGKKKIYVQSRDASCSHADTLGLVAEYGATVTAISPPFSSPGYIFVSS